MHTRSVPAAEPQRAWLHRAALILLALISIVDARAQTGVDGIRGTAVINDWPAHRIDGQTPDYEPFRLLPFIDTLRVGYRFRDVDGVARVELGIEWIPGREGILHGRRVPAGQLPERLIIESIDLLATVRSEDRSVGAFFVPLDTLRLGPSPSVALVDIEEAHWGSVFVDVDADRARRLMASGFELTDLRILRVVFAVGDDVLAAPEEDFDDDWTTVIVPDVDVWIPLEPRSRLRPVVRVVRGSSRGRRGGSGRGDLVGRDGPDRGYDRPEDDSEAGESEDPDTDRRRTRRSKGDRDGGIPIPRSTKDDDDDDDKDRLLPAALAGAALVGGLAVFGGTFGYLGSHDKAPIGLMAGRVYPRGGVLFHVAVNRQVFGKTPGPENLIAGVTGFGDLFRSPLQPAIGVGIRVTEEGTETTRTRPSLAVGFVANMKMLVLHAAYDVEAGDVRFGVGINLRARDWR